MKAELWKEGPISRRTCSKGDREGGEEIATGKARMSGKGKKILMNGEVEPAYMGKS